MSELSSSSLQFPYVRFSVFDPLTKRRSAVYRPVIPVRLRSAKLSLRCQGLIDSGADECIFPGEIATALGFPLLEGKPRAFSGIGGSVTGYLHWTVLEVGTNHFRCPVYYSDAWNHLRFGLLGQVGFLSHFKVILNHYARAAELLPTPARQR